jgi:uncharacterized repeat protein (TIGR02543 family)
VNLYSAPDSVIAARTFSLKSIVAFVVSLFLVIAGLVYSDSPAHAATIVSGDFSGYSVADVKAYVLNTSSVSMSMVTETAYATDGSTSFELVRGGGGGPWDAFTANNPSADCSTAACPLGDSRLSGFTFSILDNNNQAVSIAGASFRFSSVDVKATFSGVSNVVIPVGSTIKFSFATGKVNVMTTSTDQVQSRDVSSNTVIEQTSPYNWFKRVVFNANGTGASVSSLFFSGTEFVLSSAVSPSTTLPSTLFRAGYTFTGWNTAANGSGTAYAPGAAYTYPLQTRTLYAQWAASSSTVTFNANGGTGTLASQTASSATNLSSNTNSITRAGYTFAGWNTATNGTGTNYANGASYPFTSSTTLYAKWTANTNVVTYDSHGGSSVSDGSFTTGGSIATLPSAPTRAGYTFNGWFTASTGGSPLANGYAPAATDAITLHAQWTGTTNTVTYDTHGGSSVSAGSFVTGGAIANLPVAPTKAGYSFAGWFVAASGGSALSNGYAPSATSAITLHAQWNALAQTVTFDANGGTGTMAAQTSGSAAVLTTNTIARTGYGFTGWNTAANGSGTAYAVDATHPFTASETLYAQWRALPATPVAAVDIQVPVGSAIANAPVDLDVDGLKDQTGYTVTVFSTPQIIDQGTIWSGRLNTTVRIPSNLEAGWHRLVIVGTAADGTPWTEENFFKVSPGGILLATSEVVPAELAMTGSNSVPIFYGAGALILFGIVFLLANTTLRRRVKRND